MSKIVDIKFVSGRRAEAIEEELRKNEVLMKIARGHYEMFRASTPLSIAIEEWARSYGREFAALFPSEEVRRLNELAKQAGLVVPKIQREVSLEEKILNFLEDGWVLKGDIVQGGGLSNKWVQTLVKYETLEEPVDLLGVTY
jgi:hypothetical protein